MDISRLPRGLSDRIVARSAVGEALGDMISGLLRFTPCYGLPGCSAPCTDLTGFPADGAFYFQAFSGSVALPAAGYDYSIDWTPCWRDFHPQEWQLSSLHQHLLSTLQEWCRHHHMQD